MPDRLMRALSELERKKAEYGDGLGPRKLELLRTLDKRRLRRPREVLRLHEALCFLRAYPDDAEILARVEIMLGNFPERSDLQRHRRQLVNSGIAGTAIQFSFFAATTLWLARRWGKYLTIQWEEFEQPERLEQYLPQLALYSETPGLDEFAFEVREWIERLKNADETDAAFLFRRFVQLPMTAEARETVLDKLDIPLQLAPAPDTPARTREKYPCEEIVYQTGPLRRARPSVATEITRRPRRIRVLTPREGQTLVELARSAMAVRQRDLDAFAYGDRNDVRLVDCGHGLQFAYIGVIPERRLLLEVLYGFLMLKNGVPVGYGTYSGLFGSAEVAYTVFDSFRSGESAVMYVRALANARQLFGFDTFSVSPYQLGHDNDDAIRSGAWWFYQKLGFRPREKALLRVMRREERRMKGNRSHRTSPATLRELASADLYLHLGKSREDVIGILPLANVGLRVTQYLADRFGYDRRTAERVCAQDAARMLGVRSMRSFSPGERLAWRRWSPLLMILPGVERWSRQDRRALVAVVRSKGGRRESDYLRRFDGHRRLRRAVQRLAENSGAR